MENLSNTKAGDWLPEFQKFLLEKKLVHARHKKYVEGAGKPPWTVFCAGQWNGRMQNPAALDPNPQQV